MLWPAHRHRRRDRGGPPRRATCTRARRATSCARRITSPRSASRARGGSRSSAPTIRTRRDGRDRRPRIATRRSGEGFIYVIAGTRRFRRAWWHRRRRASRACAARAEARAARGRSHAAQRRHVDGTLGRRLAPGRGELRPGAARPTALSACEPSPTRRSHSKEPTSPPRLTRRSSRRRSPGISTPRARSSAATSGPSST